MSTDPLSLRGYRFAAGLMGPVANLLLERRLKAGKEDPERVGERRGIAGRARPEGVLWWIHGASVGESLSILPLVERLADILPDASFLVTTGTVTSAQLMGRRLPPAAFHQFAPVDQPGFVTRFLDHWRPDAALFVESELWPVMIGEIGSRNLPAALVNGRLSPKSFRSWSKRPKAARALLDRFSVLLAQDADNADRIARLAGRDVIQCGNLKRAAPPLPVDAGALDSLRAAIAGRPVWLAASTHPGEEEFVLEAHRQLVTQVPDLLTVIAPRHPPRGEEIAAEIQAAGFSTVRRSQGALPEAPTEVYLADTLGEMGLLYRASDVAFIGGSLTEVGGHNPMEPARLGSAIVTGPHVFNFSETFQSMREAGALALVRNERDLAASLLRLLKDSRTREDMAQNAIQWADDGAAAVLDDIVDALEPLISQSRALKAAAE